MKNRVNFTIDPKLHKWAKGQAEELGVDFSGYMAILLKRAQAAAKEPFRLSDDDLARLRRELGNQIREDLGLPAAPTPPAGSTGAGAKKAHE